MREWVNPSKKPVVLLRFLGTTPDSSSIHPLLISICSQLSCVYGVSLDNIPEELSQLINHFKKLLSHATAERPLFIFLDSLDQLSAVNSAHSLSWLPATLSKHAKLVVSALSDCYNIVDTLMNMIEKAENFHHVKFEFHLSN